MRIEKRILTIIAENPAELTDEVKRVCASFNMNIHTTVKQNETGCKLMIIAYEKEQETFFPLFRYRLSLDVKIYKETMPLILSGKHSSTTEAVNDPENGCLFAKDLEKLEDNDLSKAELITENPLLDHLNNGGEKHVDLLIYGENNTKVDNNRRDFVRGFLEEDGWKVNEQIAFDAGPKNVTAIKETIKGGSLRL